MSQIATDPTAEVPGFYADALSTLTAAAVDFLVGGAYALERYTGICRDTKDVDVFVRPVDAPRALASLADAGYRTELTFSHWLGKAFCEDNCLDIIFSSGNGIATVDDEWFEHAAPALVIGAPVRLNPVEEMIWSKAFIMERERYDGADIAHLINSQGLGMDWDRLLRRFDEHWRVFLSHLILFEFIYPGRRDTVPGWVMSELLDRLAVESHPADGSERLCRGTLLSREQYLADIDGRGYDDARLIPCGTLTAEQIERWTPAIGRRRHPPAGWPGGSQRLALARGLARASATRRLPWRSVNAANE